MAREEVIKINCPACGCGIIAGVNDDTVIATGDTAKKPEKSERTETDKKPDQEFDSGKGSEKNINPDPETGSGESDETQEADGIKDPESAEQTESNKGLGDW